MNNTYIIASLITIIIAVVAIYFLIFNKNEASKESIKGTYRMTSQPGIYYIITDENIHAFTRSQDFGIDRYQDSGNKNEAQLYIQ